MKPKGRDFTFPFTLRLARSPFSLVPNVYLQFFFAGSNTVSSFTNIHSWGLRIRGAMPPLSNT